MKPVFFALKRAYLASRRAVDAQFAQYGITAAQLDILMHLGNHGPVEQRELQFGLGITSATMTKLLDGMEARDLVERRPSRTDARSKLVQLTAHGLALGREMEESEVEVFDQRFMQGFGPAEVALLTEWLRRVARNMGDTSEDIFK